MASPQMAASVHASRDHSQVTTSAPAHPPPAQAEFAETTTVSLEWRLGGIRAMYETSRGDAKSKCIKSAIFGDPDNLWEVLWYPNSGVQGGEYASLYLSCVPTTQEREQGIVNKWVRKGLWWFRFEVKVLEERTGKLSPIASKDASDHTFAVKTANWGWQQFGKRDQLFLHPAVVANDSFVIVCTISGQPQPPAGYWLGLGQPGRPGSVSGSPNPLTWSGSDGASGGVAGGTFAAGGPKRVVPRDLVSAVGEMLDDPMYSDIEFVIPAPSLRARGIPGDRPSPRRIYANKKLLNRCDYFDAMFHGGFGEVEGTLSDDDDEADDGLDTMSDSDEEDDLADLLAGPLAAAFQPPMPPTTTTATTTTHHTQTYPHTLTTRDEPGGPVTPLAENGGGTTPDISDRDGDENDDDTDENDGDDDEHSTDATDAGGETPEDLAVSGGALLGGGNPDDSLIAEPKPGPAPVVRKRARSTAHSLGPRKTRVVVRDAAWSTWWAVLYYLYTDVIYFAPLSSSFAVRSRHMRTGSIATTLSGSSEPSSRREWIADWLSERGMASDTPTIGVGIAGLQGGEEASTAPVGPRPVSAKAVYRLADKLDLPGLKMRAFQHILGQLTAANIPAEVFSRFSATFEDVRKVQVSFFLKHWSEIKKSDTMQNIWKQIRDGKHVGFEEVWPLIVGQLDFRPS